MKDCKFKPEINSFQKTDNKVNVAELVKRLSTDNRRSPYRVPITRDTLEFLEHCTFSPKISRMNMEKTVQSARNEKPKIVRKLEFQTPMKNGQKISPISKPAPIKILNN